MARANKYDFSSLLSFHSRLLQETFVLCELFGLRVDAGPLFLSDLATLSDMLLEKVVGLGHLGINQSLVVEIETRGGKERDQDQGQQSRSREPRAKGPDSIKDTNKLKH